LRPGTAEEAAELLRSLGEQRRPVRPRGGGTKDWGPAIADAVEVETGGLARILPELLSEISDMHFDGPFVHIANVSRIAVLLAAHHPD